VIIESDQEDLARSVTKRKTAANPGAIGSLDLQNSGEAHFVTDPVLATWIIRSRKALLKRKTGVQNLFF
jgi:hypothetical protein